MATLKELWAIASELLGSEELTRRYHAWITQLIRVSRARQAHLAPDAAFDAEVLAILADLNSRVGSRFRPTDAVRALIRALFAAKYVREDFFKVHAAQHALWAEDPLMRKYLRPSTLYRPSHFDEYLSNWYAAANAAAEHDQKRAAARQRAQKEQPAIDAAAGEAARKARLLAAELSALPWYSFPSWAHFVRHCLQFPDAPTLNAYLAQVPERVRRMRTAPKMGILVLTNQSPAWAESEYAALKASRPPSAGVERGTSLDSSQTTTTPSP